MTAERRGVDQVQLLLNNVVRQQVTVKTIQTQMPNKPDVTEEKVKIFSQSSAGKLTLIFQQDELEDSALLRYN